MEENQEDDIDGDKLGRRSRLIRKKIDLFCCDHRELGAPENSMQMHAGTVHYLMQVSNFLRR